MDTLLDPFRMKKNGQTALKTFSVYTIEFGNAEKKGNRFNCLSRHRIFHSVGIYDGHSFRSFQDEKERRESFRSINIHKFSIVDHFYNLISQGIFSKHKPDPVCGGCKRKWSFQKAATFKTNRKFHQ